MSKSAVELWVGVFVAVGLAALAVLAFKVGNLSAGEVRDGSAERFATSGSGIGRADLDSGRMAIRTQVQ